MSMGIFEQLNWLTATVKKLCCSIQQIKESGAGSYKVYTALLTQSGGDNFQSQSSGPVQKGVTYYVDGGTIGITDFSNVGGQFQTPSTGSYYFVATVDGVPNEYGGATADYNTGAPVVTVLENTIGNIWFSYTNDAVQVINSDNLFPFGKTYATIQLNTDLYTPDQTFYSVRQNDGSTIYLFSYRAVIDDFGTPFTNTPIEIRVYN